MAALPGEQRRSPRRGGIRISPVKLRNLERRAFALRAQDPRKAAELFADLLARDPDRAASLKAGGRILMQLREYEKARSYWERLDRLSPEDNEPSLQLARIHFRGNRLQDCVVCAERVLALSPLHEEARTLRARALALDPDALSAPSPVPAAAVPSRTNTARVHAGRNLLGWFRRLLGSGRRQVDLASSPPYAPAPRIRLDVPYLTAMAKACAERGDVPQLVEALEVLAGVAGPQPVVIDTLAAHRLLIDDAIASNDSAIEPQSRAMLAVRARKLWLFLPAPASGFLSPAVEPAEHSAPPATARLDIPYLTAMAGDCARRGDVAGLVENLEVLAGVAGPQPVVIDTLAAHRPLIDEAIASNDSAIDPQSRAMLAVRARKLWLFLPEPASGSLSPAASAAPALEPAEHPAPPATVRLDIPYLTAMAGDCARRGDVAGLVENLEVLAGVAGPQPALVDALALYRPMIDAAIASAEGPLDPQSRAMLAVRARRLWLFLPSLQEPSSPSGSRDISALIASVRREVHAPPFSVRLDLPYLAAIASACARRGDVPRLIENLEVLAGVAGPQPAVVDVFSRYRPMIDAAIADTEGPLDARSQAMLGVRARRLWLFLPPVPQTPPPEPIDESLLRPVLTVPELIAAAEQQAAAGDIIQLIDSLDAMVGVAGPQAEIIDILARHRPAIDRTLAQAEDILDHPTRAMLTARARRLWAFLPEPGSSSHRAIPAAPVGQRRPLPSLIAAADEQEKAGDIARLVETLDVLAGVAGPHPEVIEALARHRPAIERALSQVDGVLDHPTRGILAIRARRLWTFLPEPATDPAPLPDLPSQQTDSAALFVMAEEQARTDDIPGLIDTLDLLAGILGPESRTIDLFTRHRPAIDAALSRSDGPLDARTRALLSARVRRLWAFLPAKIAPTAAPTPHSADAADLIVAAEQQAEADDIAGLIDTLGKLAEAAGPDPRVIDALVRHRPAIDAALADPSASIHLQGRADLAGRARRLWTFLPERELEPTTVPLEPAGPRPERTPDQQRSVDAAFLIQAAEEQAKSGEITRLIDTLDVLAGTAGPEPKVIDTLARHRPAIDAALMRTDGWPSNADRSILAVRVRHLWAFLPEQPPEAPDSIVSSVPSPKRRQPRQRPLDPASLIATAADQAEAGEIAHLIETLDVLAGIAGPESRVIDAFARHRPMIDAALATTDGPLDAQNRAMLAVRARRLWAFLPEQAPEPAPEAAKPQPLPLLDAPTLIAAANEHAAAGNVARLVEALDVLAGVAGPEQRVVDELARHRPMIDSALAITDGPLDAQTRAMLGVRARRLWTFLPESTVAANEPQAREETIFRAPRLIDEIRRRIQMSDAKTWLEGARIAAKAEDRQAVLDCAKEAIATAPHSLSVVREVTAFVAECGMHDEAIAAWRAAYARSPDNLAFALGLLRAVEATPEPLRIFDELRALIPDFLPFKGLSRSNVTAVVEMFRRLTPYAERAGSQAKLTALEATLAAHQEPSALLSWILGSFDIWRFDRSAAMQHLDDALGQPALPRGTILDLHAEKAILHARYHFYGEALAEIRQIADDVLTKNAFYQRRLNPVLAVAELCPGAPRPLRYPECLIDIVVDEIARQPLRYEPRPRQVAMISGSLGQGGGERQTITVVKHMIKDPRIEKLTLLIRSIHLRPTDDFFFPLVSELPLDCHVYGKNWYTASNIAELLPELADRPRLARAIDLMPQTIREDVIRLCRHIFDVRPQAVHIWQDITGAALACIITGVPNFFVHRGSLSPDYWGQTERQTETHFRPMRHIYRRLLERPEFVILNNSAAGNRTDQKWTDWPKSEPFQYLPNAIDFGILGPNTGRNVELRRSLGIGDHNLVVGGSFRIFSVKRPEYWIAAARVIAKAIPQAHFLIIGDGDMTELVQERAREYGIADRLHLPGRVSNVGDWYRAMDLSMLCSEREGIPNAIIEAQHFGVPIVATDVGGLPESIDPGETGFVVPGNSPDEYADRAISILRDQYWRAKAAIRAPDFVHEKFSLDRVTDRLIGYYGFIS